MWGEVLPEERRSGGSAAQGEGGMEEIMWLVVLTEAARDLLRGG